MFLIFKKIERVGGIHQGFSSRISGHGHNFFKNNCKIPVLFRICNLYWYRKFFVKWMKLPCSWNYLPVFYFN